MAQPVARGWRRVKKAVSITVITVFALLFLAPIIWLFYAAFLPEIKIFAVPPAIISDFPGTIRSFGWGSFALAFGRWNVGVALFNSIVITTSSILLTLVISSLSAYSFSFFHYRGRNALFLVCLATMMLPMVTMIAPYYRVMRAYGLLDTHLGLILPYAASAFSVFLIRQYFVRLPLALVEAAIVDGASHLRIWWRIILPLSKPVLITLAIYQFRQAWNDFLIPMIILRDERLFTFPIKLQFMSGGALMATGCIAILVPFILFLIYQRHFMEGLSGGVKE